MAYKLYSVDVLGMLVWHKAQTQNTILIFFFSENENDYSHLNEDTNTSLHDATELKTKKMFKENNAS